MSSFARARTKSWLLKLWPVIVKPNDNDRTNLVNSKELIEKQQKANKCFLEASKNGGMWFS